MNELLNAIKELDEILEFDRPLEKFESISYSDPSEINLVFAKLTKLIGEMESERIKTIQSMDGVSPDVRMVIPRLRSAIPRFNISWLPSN